jgi:hypothetical protein
MVNKPITNNCIGSRNSKVDQLNYQVAFLSQDEASVFDTIDFDPREKFDSSRAPQHFANQLQDAVDKIIQQCPDVDWNENYLSYQVVSAVRSALSRYIFPNIESHSGTSKFDVEAYKLTGQAEETHGDIAIVVSRSFHGNGRPISGVGFYEAKASSLAGHSYPAFSFQQLRHLVTNTPKLSYLLYDRNPQIADTQEWPTLQEKIDAAWDERKFCVRTVDANFVKQHRSLENAAHVMAQSFGYHFVQKTLSGRELDYSRPPIETIRRWLKVTRRTTAFVVSIAVQEDSNKPAHAQLQLPGFEKLMLQSPYMDSRKLSSE